MNVVIKNKTARPWKIRYKRGGKVPAFVAPFATQTVSEDDVKMEYLDIGKQRRLIDFWRTKETKVSVKKGRGRR